MKLPVTQDYTVQDWMIINSEMARTQKLWNNFRHYPSICLVRLNKITKKNLSQDSVPAN